MFTGLTRPSLRVLGFMSESARRLPDHQPLIGTRDKFTSSYPVWEQELEQELVLRSREQKRDGGEDVGSC